MYYGFNYLKGTNVFSNTNRYYVEYPNTDGLGVGSSVKIKGVQVGKVNSVVFQPEKNNVLVELGLEGNIQLGKKTIANLRADGFIGGKAIILNRNGSEILEPGSMLIPQVDPGFQGLLESAEPIPENIQSLLARITAIMEGMDGFGKNLSNATSRLDTTLLLLNNLLSKNDSKISSTLSQIDTLVNHLKQAAAPVEIIMSNFEALSDSLKDSQLKATIANTNELLKNLNSTLDTLTNERGTIGKLINEDVLYQNLNKMLVDLDEVLIHFNQYPRDFMKPLGRTHENLQGLKEK